MKMRIFKMNIYIYSESRDQEKKIGYLRDRFQPRTIQGLISGIRGQNFSDSRTASIDP